MSKIALYAGTFDPITYGHLDVLQSALSIADTLVIAVAQNIYKKPMFDLNERINLIKQVVDCHQNIKVMPFDNLLVDFAKSVNARILIRGIRNTTDFNYESQMANTNRTLAPTIQTVFLLPTAQHHSVSSTFVREVNALGGDCSQFVPPLVAAALKQKILLKN